MIARFRNTVSFKPRNLLNFQETVLIDLICGIFEVIRNLQYVVGYLFLFSKQPRLKAVLKSGNSGSRISSLSPITDQVIGGMIVVVSELNAGILTHFLKYI